MTQKYPPINPKCTHMLHGGDYNPDQWLDRPDILAEDIRLMKLAGCNAMSIGIFAWTALEPSEGTFTFDWLDGIMDSLAKNNAYAVLATPSGARPAWMSQKYPEVLRVDDNRVRRLHGVRHNHCYTSPIYREKSTIINTRLAERYKDHPALLVWHASNEYGGSCHCDLCQEAFRTWLKQRYSTLDKLNAAWWTGFWSHTFTDWSQIESPAPHGEKFVHGLTLDWQRFITHQTIDFFKAETAPLRKITPTVPITTNFMGLYAGLDYWKFAQAVDVISWDSYPLWHGHQPDNVRLAAEIAFRHDANRCHKGGKPFMLMESTPSVTNWQVVSKLKRPGAHVLTSIQAVAHGSDTVQYFQWRKGRGGSEKFHGAVVDHAGHENTRVFRDVSDVGAILKKLDAVVGTTVPTEAAVIFDWENLWAIEGSQGPRREHRDYTPTCFDHYTALWQRGVLMDIVNEDCDFSKYKLLIAPMLYMVRSGVGERIEKFVRDGGTFVTTYWSGIADESDLCFLGGFPGPLRKTLGIWSEEIDALYEQDSNSVVMAAGNALGLSQTYKAGVLCDLIHAETAQVLATYGQDFYAGRPALTVNSLGKGKAYYIASRNEQRFTNDVLGKIAGDLSLRRAVQAELPQGVSAQMRTDGKNQFLFLMNFSDQPRVLDLPAGSYRDMVSGAAAGPKMTMAPFGTVVLQVGK